MIFIALIVIIIVLIFVYIGYKYEHSFYRKSSPEIKNVEIIRTLLTLDEKSLEELFGLYKKQFGTGAARYARKTYAKWKMGKVRPNRQTFERFLIHLPKVMSYELKCEVLRSLMKEYCPKENYNLTVTTNDWEKPLAPLVKTIIDKAYTAELPNEIQEKLNWLAEDEMHIARDILRNSQIEEGKIAVSMLAAEFRNIEHLLENVAGRSKVTHQLNFSHGTITLNIKGK